MSAAFQSSYYFTLLVNYVQFVVTPQSLHFNMSCTKVMHFSILLHKALFNRRKFEIK